MRKPNTSDRIPMRLRLMRGLVLRSLKQLQELILPQTRKGVTAVPAGLVARWNNKGAPVRHAFDLALEDLQLRRIDQVIGRVDREQRRTNFFQVRARIVIA